MGPGHTTPHLGRFSGMSHSGWDMPGPLSLSSSIVPNQGQAIPSPVPKPQGWPHLLAGGRQLMGLRSQHHQIVDDALQVGDLPQHGQLAVLRRQLVRPTVLPPPPPAPRGPGLILPPLPPFPASQRCLSGTAWDWCRRLSSLNQCMMSCRLASGPGACVPPRIPQPGTTWRLSGQPWA